MADRLCRALVLLASTAVAVAVTAQELPAFQIVMKDGRFSPERLEVPTGKRFKLVLKNEGRGPAEFENLSMRIEKVLAPGVTSFVVLPALKPGEYRFSDEFRPDSGGLTLVAK
ncbi:MAG: iron transporter [Betaproteobacteria bacterium RIFCSPLOWO2_12_FULL_68_20]|nr:MAG: iron transporter [Betaproteobacteria bacterium RIFCSPLOWO2_12_FULL_68_20]